MNFRRPGSIAAALVGGALLVVQTAGAARQPCCFTNPQYAGVCAVQPGEGETCASILGYLNNPRSQGKSYCGNTNIRGGWKQVVCPSKNDAARSRSQGSKRITSPISGLVPRFEI
jgi:hypothetical protein